MPLLYLSGWGGNMVTTESPSSLCRNCQRSGYSERYATDTDYVCGYCGTTLSAVTIYKEIKLELKKTNKAIPPKRKSDYKY